MPFLHSSRIGVGATSWQLQKRHAETVQQKKPTTRWRSGAQQSQPSLKVSDDSSSVFFFFSREYFENVGEFWSARNESNRGLLQLFVGYHLQKNAGYWLFVLAMRVSWSRFNIPRLFTVCYMTKHFVFSGIEFFIPRYEETDKLRTFFKVAWPSSVARLFCSGHSNFHVGEFCFFFLVLILVVHSEIPSSSLNSILLRENFHFVSFICFRR